MTDKKRTKLILGNALAWAGAILLTAWFTKGAVDKNTSFTITMFLVAGWFMVNGLIMAGSGALKEDMTCIRRRFGRS